MRLLGALALTDLVLGVAVFRFGVPSGWVAAWGAGGVHVLLTLVAVLLPARSAEMAGWNGLARSVGAIGGPCLVLILGYAGPWAARRSLPPPRSAPVPSWKPAPPFVAQLIDRRLRFPAAHAVEDLATILRHGDLASRCKALETVVRAFEPRLSPLVARALGDPDQTMRALAAATTAQVTATLMDGIARMEAIADPTLDETYEYAMLLFENGMHNVLLSQAQRGELRGKARAALLKLEAAAPALGARAAAVTRALGQLRIDPARTVAPDWRPDHPRQATG